MTVIGPLEPRHEETCFFAYTKTNERISCGESLQNANFLTDFSDQFRKIIMRYKRIGTNLNVMRVCMLSYIPNHG